MLQGKVSQMQAVFPAATTTHILWSSCPCDEEDFIMKVLNVILLFDQQ